MEREVVRWWQTKAVKEGGSRFRLGERGRGRDRACAQGGGVIQFSQSAGLRAIGAAICLTVASQAVVEKDFHDMTRRRTRKEGE